MPCSRKLRSTRVVAFLAICAARRVSFKQTVGYSCPHSTPIPKLDRGVYWDVALGSMASARRLLRVLVLDDLEGVLAASPAIARLRSTCDVRVLSGTPPGKAVADGAGDATPATLRDLPEAERADVDVLVAVRERTTLDAATLALLPNLELIAQTGGHAYHLDVEEATGRGVAVALGRGVKAAPYAVTELTFALMLGAMRRLPEAVTALATGAFPLLEGRVLAGRRLGLLGAGRHGANAGRVAHAFGMEVVAWDRNADDDAGMDAARGGSGPGGAGRPGDFGAPAGAEFDVARIPRLGLRALLATSDVVSVHLRLSDESRGLLDAARLAQMKEGAVLVNTARGAIVDEAALAEALADEAHPLAAAGLDVFTVEPLPEDSPLRSLKNVVMTPHVGWTVLEVLGEFADIAAAQIEAYMAGELDARTLVNAEATRVDRRRFPGAGFKHSE